MGFGPNFESVLEAARLGTDWAWAAIYREIAGPVTGFLRARGVDEPLEVTGHVFFDVSRNIQSFDGDEEDFRVYVFEFAYQRMDDARYADAPPRSRLADRVLDRIRRDISVLDPVTEDAAAPIDSEPVRRAFELLSQEQRDVISLRAVAGLSVEQTAEVVSQSAATVREAQRKAIARLARSNIQEVLTP